MSGEGVEGAEEGSQVKMRMVSQADENELLSGPIDSNYNPSAEKEAIMLDQNDQPDMTVSREEVVEAAEAMDEGEVAEKKLKKKKPKGSTTTINWSDSLLRIEAQYESLKAENAILREQLEKVLKLLESKMVNTSKTSNLQPSGPSLPLTPVKMQSGMSGTVREGNGNRFNGSGGVVYQQQQQDQAWTRPKQPYHPYSSGKSFSPKPSSYVSTPPKSIPPSPSPALCLYCYGSHWSHACIVFPDAEARSNHLLTSHKCPSCLTKHQGSSCPAPLTTNCKYCNGHHHKSLCPYQFS